MAEILKVSIEDKAERKQGAPLGFKVSRPCPCLAPRAACGADGSQLAGRGAEQKQGQPVAQGRKL